MLAFAIWRWFLGGPGEDVPDPSAFRVLAVGTSGSGKTVLLASLFDELSQRSQQRPYVLDTDPHSRLVLNGLFSQLSDPATDFEPGTMQGDAREYRFQCRPADPADRSRSLFEISYWEYSGEIMHPSRKPDRPALDELVTRIGDAHAVLGLIDGLQVRRLLRGEDEGIAYFREVVQPMLAFIKDATCPIQLVLTKWDVVRDFGEPADATDDDRLQCVIARLRLDVGFADLVEAQRKRQTVRLIPVSALGPDFTTLDEAGNVVKRADGTLVPKGIEVPLCAVLSDLLHQAEQVIDRSVRRRVVIAIWLIMLLGSRPVVSTVLTSTVGLLLRKELKEFGGDEAAKALVELLVGRRTRKNDERADFERLRAEVLERFKWQLWSFEEKLPSSKLAGL